MKIANRWQTGFLASLIFIPLYAVFTTGAMASVLNRGYYGFIDYVLAIYHRADVPGRQIWQYIGFWGSSFF